MRSQRAGMLRSAAWRSSAISLANACSIGLRVGRQVDDAGAPGLDRLADTRDLVGGEVVHDDDVARPQRRRARQRLT